MEFYHSISHVIPAKAGIQYFQMLFWIPVLCFAAAGMTSLVAGLIIYTVLHFDPICRSGAP